MSTELAKIGGALAIRPDQTDWTPEQAMVLQQSGIDEDVTKAELAGFLHLCQRTRLDPFSRQIYLIGRKDKRAGRKVFTPQTGIDGYRVVAHRVIAETGDAFGYEDTLWCDAAGAWRDVWLPDEAPAAAKVTVLRNGQRFSAVALYREYVQTDYNGNPTRMWKTMGANQIAKCAEALALRKAFPHDLAGVYTAEEMAQADNATPEEGQAPERHLRRVQPGETDQWASSTPATAAEGRDYLHEASAAATAAGVRKIYDEAKADGAVPVYLAQIAKVGVAKEKAEAEAAKASEKTGDEPVDVTVVGSPEDEHAAAVDQLREAAEAARLEDFENGARMALGMPIEQASAEAIRTLAQQIRPAA